MHNYVVDGNVLSVSLKRDKADDQDDACEISLCCTCFVLLRTIFDFQEIFVCRG